MPPLTPPSVDSSILNQSKVLLVKSLEGRSPRVYHLKPEHIPPGNAGQTGQAWCILCCKPYYVSGPWREGMQDAVALVCGHVYCLACVSAHVDKNKDSNWGCEECGPYQVSNDTQRSEHPEPLSLAEQPTAHQRTSRSSDELNHLDRALLGEDVERNLALDDANKRAKLEAARTRKTLGRKCSSDGIEASTSVSIEPGHFVAVNIWERGANNTKDIQ